MKHYVITRFNLRRPEDKHLNPGWLDYRFTLFDRFCYATMRRQVNQDFKWFILFHRDTPGQFLERIEGYAQWEPFVPIFVDGRAVVSETISQIGGWPGSTPGRQACQQILDEASGEWIITTRLDSDDAVSVDFTHTIQQAAREVEETLNFPSGWKWYRGVLCRFSHPRNPFLSYVEQAKNLKTVYQRNHGLMVQLPSRQIESAPQWMIVCHGDNISNRCTTARPPSHPFWTPETQVLKHFPLDLTVPVSESAIAGKPSFKAKAKKAFKYDFFPDIIAERYDDLCNTSSDIDEHLPTLCHYARQCQHVTEFGVRNGVSTAAFLNAHPATLISYDVEQCLVIDELMSLRGVTDFRFVLDDVLNIEIEPTDLMFVDTFHTCSQLSLELKLHADRVRRWIIMHDTTTYGDVGEDGGSGLSEAIEMFLSQHAEWSIVADYKNNNGLIVMERKDAQ